MASTKDETLHKQNKQDKRGKACFAAAAACCGSIGLGTTLAYSSPAIPELQTDSVIHLDGNISGWFGSIVAIGVVIAAPVTGIVIEKFGRKDALLYSSVPFIIGWLLIAYANNVAFLLIGRVITGFSVGLLSSTVPVYVAEIAPPHLRGLLGSCVQLASTLGMFMAYAFGIFVSWRWLAILCTIFPILLLIFMCFVPETPRWLMMKHRRLEASKAVLFFNGTQINAEAECQMIEDNLSAQPKGSVSLRELLQPRVMKLMLFGLALIFFQQSNGIPSFIFYTESIFKSGHAKINAKYSTTIVGAVQVVATLAASILMDRAGRRILLLISGSIMCISVSVFATYRYLVHINVSNVQTRYEWIPLVCLCVFVTGYSLGYGPIPWLMMAELLPVRVRGLACSFAVIFGAGCAFVVTKEFNDMLNTIQDYGTYWTYGGFCLLSCVFVYVFLPETKGKPLEDIERNFINCDELSTVHAIN